MEYTLKELQKIFNAMGYNQLQCRRLSRDTINLLDFFSLMEDLTNGAEITPDNSFSRENLEILVEFSDSIDKLTKEKILSINGDKEYSLNKNGIQNLVETDLEDEPKYIIS